MKFSNVLSYYGADQKSRRQVDNVSGSSTPINRTLTDEEDVYLKKSSSRSRKYQLGLSSSDAEIDYRRGRSLRGGKGDFECH